MWDAYREEVEEWAEGRRRRGRVVAGREIGGDEGVMRAEGGMGGDEGGAVGDLDGMGMGGVGQGEGEGEGGLFEGVPVGIREFMGLEKRLREKGRRGGGEG